jgi:DNA-binding NtrC family response regulator
VRELENTVAELLALSDDGVLANATERGFPAPQPHDLEAPAPGKITPLRERLARFENELIVEALGLAGHNQSQAARLLGTTRTTLIDKMKRLGIKP